MPLRVHRAQHGLDHLRWQLVVQVRERVEVQAPHRLDQLLGTAFVDQLPAHLAVRFHQHVALDVGGNVPPERRARLGGQRLEQVGELRGAQLREPRRGPLGSLAEMARHGLERGKNGLQVYVMCEIPSNVVLAEAFAARFDGFSIGSNDLTKLVLRVDRDSALLAALFDERSEAVKETIAALLAKAKKSGTKTGLCGQAPSTHPEFAEFLVAHGIDSISVTPDSFIAVKRAVARAESA